MKNSCPLSWWWHLVKFFTAIRAYTGEKPAQLQVLWECSHPTNIGYNENLIVTIMMVTYAQFLHCHENTYRWETCQMTGAGRSYSLNRHDCNNKNNFTVLLVVCTLFLQCHVDKYWWEHAQIQLLPGFISIKKMVIIYFCWTCDDMSSVSLKTPSGGVHFYVHYSFDTVLPVSHIAASMMMGR